MFSGATQAARRFSLLLLDEGERYAGDWVATARWPPGVAGNWQRAPRLPGQLRLATKSLFFEPDDARVPIVRRVLWDGCLARMPAGLPPTCSRCLGTSPPNLC